MVSRRRAVLLLLIFLAGAIHLTCGANRQPSPLFVIAFYDWYNTRGDGSDVNSEHWTFKVDWEQFGLSREEIGHSHHYYEHQISLIRELGVDGMTYEFLRKPSGQYLLPRPALIETLQDYRLRVGPFYDWESMHVSGIPVLSGEPYVNPDDEVVRGVVQDLQVFYDAFPESLWLRDASGNLLIWFFAFGFPRDDTRWQAWDSFYRGLISGLESLLGHPVVIYWTAINAPQLEYAFQHFPHKIKPFHFVLDTPQHAFGHDSVTWNIVYDNLGVWCTHGLQRVIRDDLRYISEPYWLARETRPSVVFIYSWNEYFEGANLMPDRTFGFSRYNLVKQMIQDIRRCVDCGKSLPSAAIVVDDWSMHPDDWHTDAQREFLLYALRRMLPQADAFVLPLAQPDRLAEYDVIFSLQRSDPSFGDVLLRRADAGRTVVYLNPTADASDRIIRRFARRVTPLAYHAQAMIDDAPVHIRDEVRLVELEEGVEVLLTAALDQIDETAPILMRKGSIYWVNFYWPHDVVLEPLFADIYGRDLERAILFGEGLRSQRLEIAPDGAVAQNTFSAPAAIQHPALPVPQFTVPTPVLVDPCFTD